MAEDGKKSLKFWQSKSNYSSITDDTPMKLNVHNHSIVIYIQHKFHERPSIGYLVMAEDRKNHCNFGNQRFITLLNCD